MEVNIECYDINACKKSRNHGMRPSSFEAHCGINYLLIEAVYEEPKGQARIKRRLSQTLTRDDYLQLHTAAQMAGWIPPTPDPELAALQKQLDRAKSTLDEAITVCQALTNSQSSG